VLVPCGGGGLIAGIATAIKAVHPALRVVGVQAEGAAAYPGSLAEGHPIALQSMSTMADGIAVGCPGDVPFRAIQQHVDEIVTVSEESLSRALLMLLERAKLVVAPPRWPPCWTSRPASRPRSWPCSAEATSTRSC
jgi:threonine dehydratase